MSESKKYYYNLVEGAEGRTFINTKTYSNGVIESDVELISPYVTEVQVKQPDANQEQPTNEETN